MKTVIAYFSFTGNNDLLAKEIQKRTGADLVPILESHKRNGWTVFLDIVFNRTPDIKNYHDPTPYHSQYIFVAPVWAGRIASPLKAFILWEKKKIKKYSFITICGDSSLEQKSKITTALTELIGHPPMMVEELGLVELLKERKLKTSTTRFQLTESDLKFYDLNIEKFLTGHAVDSVKD